MIAKTQIPRGKFTLESKYYAQNWAGRKKHVKKKYCLLYTSDPLLIQSHWSDNL